MSDAIQAPRSLWRASRLRSHLRGRSLRTVASTAGVNVGMTLLTSIGGILLARRLGAADRGGLVVVLQWPALFGSVASLGLTQSVCYWISRRRNDGVAIVTAAIRAALLTGVLVGVAGYFVAPVIGRTTEVTTLLRALFLLSPLYIAAGVWMSALQAIDIPAWNRARMVQPVAYFAGIFVLALAGHLTLMSATVTFCGSLLLQAWSARYGSRRLADQWVASGTRFLGMLYRYGVRVWISTIPQLINVRLDLLALSLIPAVSSAQLGVYAVAASLSWLALPAATAFGSIAFPAVARARSERAIRRIERVSLFGSACTTAVVLVVVCVVAPFAVPRVFGSDYSGAVVCLWLLAPGTVCLAMNRVFDSLLQGRGRPLSTAIGEGIAAALTVLLLLILTPQYGIRGAALASSAAYLSSSLILWWRLQVVRRHPTVSTSGASIV